MSSPVGLESGRIHTVFDTLVETFGSAFRAELVSLESNGKATHLRGADILRETEARGGFNKAELQAITAHSGHDIGEQGVPWQLYEISPSDLLREAMNCASYTLVSLGQLTPPLKTVKLELGEKQYAVIMDSRHLSYELTQEKFHDFWGSARSYLSGSRHDLRIEYISRQMPGFIRKKFPYVVHSLTTLSMMRIENKPVEFGVLFVEDYSKLMRTLPRYLIMEFDDKIDFRDLARYPQPLLDVVDGHKGFLVVDGEMAIRGLFYPLLPPEGVDPIPKGDYKQIQTSAVLAMVRGTRLVRVVAGGKIAFELHDGKLGVRDYDALVEMLEHVGREITPTVSGRDLAHCVLDVSGAGKGTIIVLGCSDVPEDATGGMRSTIDIRHDQKLRGEMLRQLSATDGALILDRKGRVRAFGAILTVEQTQHHQRELRGGTRSYVAEAFATQHPELTVIKISEDGPISIYRNGVLALVV